MDPLDELSKASRSVRVSIHNSTSKKLALKSHPIISGSWKVQPPEIILPLSTVEFGTEGNILQGTEAGSIYVLEGKENEGQFEFFWNNPGFGKKGFRRVSPAGFESEYRATEHANCVLSFTVKEMDPTMKDVDEIEREINDITVMINETENVLKGTNKMLQVYQSQNDQKQVKLVESTIASKNKHLEDLKSRREAQIKEIAKIKEIESDPKAMEKILSTIRESIESAVKARKGMEHMRELYEKQKDTKSLEGLDKQVEMKKNEIELLRKKEQKVIQKVVELKKALGLGNTMAAINKKRVIANYDYQKNSEDELELKAGDIIEICQEDNPDWFGGILNGKMGYFPRSFVVDYTAPQTNNASASAGASTGAETEDFSDLYPKARAIYAHNASDNTQISLKVGDIITVYSWEDDYWWDGTVNGQTGYFPQECVDWIEPEDSSDYSYYESSGDDNSNNSATPTPVAQSTPQPVAVQQSPAKPTVTPTPVAQPTPTPTPQPVQPTPQPIAKPIASSTSPQNRSTGTLTAPILKPVAQVVQPVQEPPKLPQKRELPSAPKNTITPQQLPLEPTSATSTPTLPLSNITPPSPVSGTPPPSSPVSSFDKLLQPILADFTKRLMDAHQKETAALQQRIAALERELKDLKDSKPSVPGNVVSKATAVRKY